jgi:hypothetical protein
VTKPVIPVGAGALPGRPLVQLAGPVGDCGDAAGVSELGQGWGWGRVAPCKTPDMPRGPVRPTPTPDHSGTVHSRKAAPLWLQVPGYVYPLTLCQDHLRVSGSAVLVTTRTAFPPQVSAGI